MFLKFGNATKSSGWVGNLSDIGCRNADMLIISV